MTDGDVDSREFRDLMGRFATGVTVLTLRSHGAVRGMTANAVSSLSLHPPLLLVCIDQNASSHPLFETADAFAVNILAEDQREASDFFASSGEKPEPLGDFPHHDGPLGSPILDEAVAWVECEVSERHAGGDHTIVIGRVAQMEIARPEAAPLLFFGGKYHRLGEPL
jgi:flavin reductase (DIM6/NTAB) family NADH-FMN oxidoreductase RutF